jgi:hypothetical protein
MVTPENMKLCRKSKCNHGIHQGIITRIYKELKK